MSRSYSTAQVMEIAGLSPREIDYWRRAGYVTPSVAKASGTGSKQRWSEEDVWCAVAVATLRRAGVELTSARRIVPMVRDAADHRWAYVGDDTAGTCAAGEVESAIVSLGAVVVVDLDQVRRSTDAWRNLRKAPAGGDEMRERFGKEAAVT